MCAMVGGTVFFVAVKVHCTNTAGATTIIATGTTSSATHRVAAGISSRTIAASTASYKVQSGTFLNISGNNGMATTVCIDSVFSVCMAAASTPQVNLIGCIERSSPRRILVIRVIGSK